MKYKLLGLGMISILGWSAEAYDGRELIGNWECRKYDELPPRSLKRIPDRGGVFKNFRISFNKRGELSIARSFGRRDYVCGAYKPSGLARMARADLLLNCGPSDTHIGDANQMFIEFVSANKFYYDQWVSVVWPKEYRTVCVRR